MTEKLTKEQHYHGLKHWVDCYKKMRRYKNVRGAIELRDKIKTIINQENLDPNLVWGDDPDQPRF